MTIGILTLNAGSSSLKFALFAIAGDGPVEVLRGLVDGLGAKPRLIVRSPEGKRLAEAPLANEESHNHKGALAEVLDFLNRHNAVSITAVGHRVVHGGVKYHAPVLVDTDIINDLKRLNPLAPLHQVHNIGGIEAAREVFPGVPQVACFDTAFHRTHSWVNDTFGLPRGFYDEGVRRYGFHGLSYEYVSAELARIAPRSASGRVVIAHLGNGASMCGLLDRKSVSSTMSFSTLDGLCMGTRCGQIDPGVLLYLLRERGLRIEDLSALLYHGSGLKGMSGISQDMREIEAAGTPAAAQAIDYFVHRARAELGSLAAILSGLDALVFCGGIGEHAAGIRQRICAGFEWLGLILDEHKNAHSGTVISSEDSRVKVFVIPTNEELVIARHSQHFLKGEHA